METVNPSPATEAPTAPGPAPDRGKWPFRIVGALALGLAVAFCVYAFSNSPDQAADNPVADPAIVQQIPTPGSHVLRQSQVGVLLQNGYDGRITVAGIPIPEDQMDGALDPSNAAQAAEVSRYGVRPNDKNQVFFTPGPGKPINRYTSGEVSVTVTFWQISLGPSHSRSVSWAFFVT